MTIKIYVLESLFFNWQFSFIVRKKVYNIMYETNQRKNVQMRSQRKIGS